MGFFTASGLDSEGAVILIATEAHRHEIKKYLKSDANIDPLEASGQLAFLDAGEVMSSFMVYGDPDPRLFKEGIRTLIERARYDAHGRIRDVRVFGEMVDLLWPENTEAAERVEELGNEIAAEYSIQILCAYSLHGPGRSKLPDSILGLHSHSITW